MCTAWVSAIVCKKAAPSLGGQVAGLEWQIWGLARPNEQECGASDWGSSESSFRSWRFEGGELALPVSDAGPQLWLWGDWVNNRFGGEIRCM